LKQPAQAVDRRSAASRLFAALAFWAAAHTAAAQSLAVTLDDGPRVAPSPLMTPVERNEAILRHLREKGVQAMFFVTLKNGADRPEGLALLKRLADGGQVVGNHTVSHPDFNADATTLEAFEAEITGCDDVIRTMPGYRKMLRFPFLREGAQDAKRDGVRAFLSAKGYRIGYVSIDTSDWVVDQNLQAALARDPGLDLAPWRELYLGALWDNAQAYERLGQRLYGRSIKHVLLLHHNLVSALFLGDMIDMFRARGWQIVGPDEAFSDPAYQVAPMIPRLDGSVLETTAEALGVPLQPSLSGIRSESRVRKAAEDLAAPR
jgi:peptidoglycan/xylan/chitin deacetylase (PgdA/CDA1 family)